ncbi:YecA family protein [Desulfobacula sp.]
MVFKKDESIGKSIATILKDGITETFDCSFSSCTNPVCTCKSIEITLTPLQDENLNRQILSSHRVDIDLIEKKLNSGAENKTPPKDSAFANLFLSQLNDDDFTFLFKKQFAFKNQITEKADIDTIEGFFDYEAVEQEGLMYAYNDVLPYGDQMQVNINGEDYLIFDQYCLLPKCSCTDTNLDIVSVKETNGEAEKLCSLTLKYAKKRWGIAEWPSSSIALGTIRFAIEEQNTDFYKQLLIRHKKLKAIYLNCRQKNFSAVQPIKTLKIGRNDPCPCGSGKKYKKCCL